MRNVGAAFTERTVGSKSHDVMTAYVPVYRREHLVVARRPQRSTPDQGANRSCSIPNSERILPTVCSTMSSTDRGLV